MQAILDALGASRYVAHALCLTFDPVLMLLFTASDFMTFLAYMTIGLCLLMTRVEFFQIRPAHRVLFGAFIAACGLSHLTMVMTLYVGVYRLDVIVRAAMAGISVVTAAVVFRDFVSEKLWRAR